MRSDRLRCRWWLSLSLIATALLGSCGRGTHSPTEPRVQTAVRAVALGPSEKLNVVATTNIVGDVVSRVGGDRIALTTLMGIGVEAHTYVATPSDTAAIYDAHVVFANGAGLEEGLIKILKDASGRAVEVQLSDGLLLIPAPAGTEAQQSGSRSGQREMDPHTWFDVRNVIAWVSTVQRTLSALDPANAPAFQANAGSYTQELQTLDAWILEQVAAVPQTRRKLVTNHLAFEYLAHRYGFEQVGAIYPISPSSEPSAQDVAALEEAIRQFALPAIFTESTVSPKLADQVAQDTGVRLVSLYTESLGPAGSGVESYIDLMRYDVSAIVSALQ